MNILSVDTSGNVCTVAVLCDNKVLSEIYVDNKMTHSQTLGPMIDDVLKLADLSISDIDMFACAVGPGSFTGLRIGVGMIKAFCHSSGKKCVAVNTLDALAYNLKGDQRLVCPVIDARRMDVYTATYKQNKRISEYRALQISDLLNQLNGEDAVFVGDGSIAFEEQILETGFTTAHRGVSLQRASSVGLLAYERRDEAISAYELEPFYLRQTQAERVYAEKHKDKK